MPTGKRINAVDDISTDMSADTNDDELKSKINELLGALRDSDLLDQ